MREPVEVAPGSRFEILPAFNSETFCRDIWDEVAGCEITITRVNHDGTVDGIIGGEDDWNVHRSRLK